jgi:hypothetical protein
MISDKAAYVQEKNNCKMYKLVISTEKAVSLPIEYLHSNARGLLDSEASIVPSPPGEGYLPLLDAARSLAPAYPCHPSCRGCANVSSRMIGET